MGDRGGTFSLALAPALGLGLALTLAGGCIPESAPGDGGQIGEEEGGARCEVASRTPLARDEVSPLGFSPADVLDFAAGEHERELVWSKDGAVTPVTVEIVESGGSEYVTQEVVSDGDDGGIEPALTPFCPNYVSLGVELAVATGDGALAEAWTTALAAESADAVHASFPLDDGLAGTFDAWDHVPDGSDYDELRAWLDLSVDPDGASGVISGQGSGTVGDPSDPNSAAYAEGFEIARFGPLEE